MNIGLQVTATSATDLIRWYSLPPGLVNTSDKSSGKTWQHEKYSTFFHSSTLQKPRPTSHYVLHHRKQSTCIKCRFNTSCPFLMNLLLSNRSSILSKAHKIQMFHNHWYCSSDSALHAEFISEPMRSAAFKRTKRTSLQRSRTLIPVPAWIQLVTVHSGRCNIDLATVQVCQ